MPTALDLSFPFDAQDSDEADWRTMFRNTIGSGVLAGIASELQVFADSSGKQVKVRAGEGWVEGHFGKSTSTKTIGLDDNVSGVDRTDLIIMRADFAGNVVELDKLTGTPGVASMTRDSSKWEVPLAQVGPIQNGYTTVSAGMVADRRAFIGPRTLPAFANAEALFMWGPPDASGAGAYLRDSFRNLVSNGVGGFPMAEAFDRPLGYGNQFGFNDLTSISGYVVSAANFGAAPGAMRMIVRASGVSGNSAIDNYQMTRIRDLGGTNLNTFDGLHAPGAGRWGYWSAIGIKDYTNGQAMGFDIIQWCNGDKFSTRGQVEVSFEPRII
jgi:hypothetical protein